MSRYVDTTGLAKQGGVAASAVEAELQRYVEEKGVNDLFINITEHLLMVKPDNPVQFVIDYLRERYPDQVAAPHGGFDGGAELKYRGSEAGSADEEEDDESESESDEDDYVDELPQVATAEGMARRRRAVSAEAGRDPAQLAERVSETAAPKSEEAAARICDWLAQNALFHHLAPEDLRAVANAFQSASFSAGDALARQGDPGHAFFLVDSGECQFMVNTAVSQALARGDPSPADAEDGDLVLRAQPGDSFGELALLYGAPRSATVRATTDVAAWTLDRATYQTIVVGSAFRHHQRQLDLVSRVSLLSELTRGEQETVADGLQPELFESGTVIIRQGEAGHKVYLVQEGEVAVAKRVTPSHPPRHLLSLGPGHYFGEIALLSSRPRQASVTATADTVCLSMDRKTFARVVAPMQRVLQRDMDKYKEVVGQQV